MKSHANIVKGTIVWYFQKKPAHWRRGKVIAVNRYHIAIKGRRPKKVIYAGYADIVIPASMRKPAFPPDQIHWKWWKRFEITEEARLAYRLGVINIYTGP